MGQMHLLFRSVSGIAAGAVLFFATSIASAEQMNYPCDSSPVEARYITPEDLGRLRMLRQQATSSAPFLDLANDDVPLVDEVLRVGPSAGFYAARLLRDFAILDAFERQAQCDPKQYCPKSEIIAGFSVESKSGADGSRTWQTLIRDWKEFRDRDAARGRACLAISRTRPTYEIVVVAKNEPKPLPAEVNQPTPDDRGAACRRLIQEFLGNRLVHFASGKAVVRREDRQFLAEAAERIAACKTVRIAIVGHTDSDGPRRYNQRLSRRRAEAVATILTKVTAVDRRLSVSGMGESNPAKPNTTRANKAYNRRVSMQIL